MSHSLKENILPCHHHHKPLYQHHRHGNEDQEHGHSHELNLHRPKQRKALFISVILTLGMMVVEFIAGYLYGSLMLISDGIHMLSHASALAISYLAVRLAKRKVSEKYPFGLYRIEILAALLNGITLAGFSFWIVYEAVQRILNPVTVIGGRELTLVAIIGLAVNLTTAFILWRSGVEDLNTKSAFLHMLADTFSSVVIIIGGVIIVFTNFYIVDPILSIVVAVLVARWSWGLLRDSILILLERTPSHLQNDEIKKHLLITFPLIKDVHDLHIWEITSQYTCASFHIVTEDLKISETQQLCHNISIELKHKFSMAHCVVQPEC